MPAVCCAWLYRLTEGRGYHTSDHPPVAIHDDVTVTALQAALEIYGVSVWAYSRCLSPREEWTLRIQKVIASAEHFMVLLSPRAISSHWVYKSATPYGRARRSSTRRATQIPTCHARIRPYLRR